MNELDYLEFRKPKPMRSRRYLVTRAIVRILFALLLVGVAIGLWTIIYLAVWSFSPGSATAVSPSTPSWTRGPCLPTATNCPVATVPDWAKQ